MPASSDDNSPNKDTRTVGKSKTSRMLNVPLLVGTLIALAVLCPAAYCWHLHQLGKTAGSLLQQAGRLEEEQEYAKAAAYIHRYLRLHPDDATARVRLAKTFDKGANDGRSKWRAAELHYRALGLGHDVIDDATRRDLRCRLAELLIETAQFASAEKEAKELLKANDEVPQAWRHLASALYGQFRSGAFSARPQAEGPWDAVPIIEAFDRAIELNPTEIQLAETFARICRDEERLCTEEKEALGKAFVRICLRGAEPSAEEKQGLDEERKQLADKVVDQMVAANPNGPEAYLARHLYRIQYKLDGAKDDLESALDQGPKNLAVLLAAAEHARREVADAQQRKASADEIGKCLDDASRYYGDAIKVAPSDERAYVGLGDVLQAQGALYQAQGARYQAQNEAEKAQDELEKAQRAVDRAIELWQQGLEMGNEEDIGLNTRLADVLINLDRLEQFYPDDKDGKENPKNPLSVLDRTIAKRAPTLRRAVRIPLERSNALLRARWLVRKRDYPKA
ncbi:MAG: tetratricopeptide repeat protein, partial [Planctomycetota bacterium]